MEILIIATFLIGISTASEAYFDLVREAEIDKELEQKNSNE